MIVSIDLAPAGISVLGMLRPASMYFTPEWITAPEMPSKLIKRVLSQTIAMESSEVF